MIGAQPEEIFFTSSGTESDHWAIWGARACAKLVAGDPQTPHIVTSAIEHPAVIQYLDSLQEEVRRSIETCIPLRQARHAVHHQ